MPVRPIGKNQMSSVDSLTTAASWNLDTKPRLVCCIKPFEAGASATEKKAMQPISSVD